jgi:hypothetical protein
MGRNVEMRLSEEVYIIMISALSSETASQCPCSYIPFDSILLYPIHFSQLNIERTYEAAFNGVKITRRN